jgi:hypothetical protein
MVRTVTDLINMPEDFRSAMRTDVEVSLVITDGDRFRARLTRVALQCLRVTSVEEELSRIAFFRVRENRICFAFLFGQQASQVWGGINVSVNNLIALQPGHAVHVRTNGPSHWATVWFPTRIFHHYAEALLGEPFVLPTGMCLWQPTPALARRLRYLHSTAIRAARVRWRTLTAIGAAHGLEQQLIHTLIRCLSGNPASTGSITDRRHQELAVRFENLLRSEPSDALGVPDIIAALNVPEQSFGQCCERVFGMTPIDYLRQRKRGVTAPRSSGG